MKKILFAMLMLLTTGMSGFAQTLTVANGTETNAYVPIYGYYADDYLISQTIYPASMLATMNGEDIISMLFYLSSSPASNWGRLSENSQHPRGTCLDSLSPLVMN